MKDIDSVTQFRLRELEDHAAIEELIYRFSSVETRGSVESYLDLFTPDGEHETRWAEDWPDERAGSSRVIRGHSALGDHVTWLLGRNMTARRFVSHLKIDLDGDRATGVMFRIKVDPKGSTPEVTYGRYVDEYVRTADGVWRIKRRVFEISAVPPAPLSGVECYVPWDSYAQ